METLAHRFLYIVYRGPEPLRVLLRHKHGYIQYLRRFEEYLHVLDGEPALYLRHCRHQLLLHVHDDDRRILFLEKIHLRSPSMSVIPSNHLTIFYLSLRAKGGVISRKRLDRHDHYVVSRKQLGEDDDKSVTEDESFFIPPPSANPISPPLAAGAEESANPPTSAG